MGHFKRQSITRLNNPWNVVVGDLNQDGFLDLAVSADGGSYAAILQGNGDGTFKPYTTAFTGASQVGSVAIGDFNGDGYPDLATTSAPDSSIYILINKARRRPAFRLQCPWCRTTARRPPRPTT